MIRSMSGPAISIVFVFLALATAGCASKSPAELQSEAFDHLRANVQSVVADPDRARQAIALVGQLEDNFDNIVVNRATRFEGVRVLNADYDASRDDFISLFEAIEGEIEAHQQQVSDLYGQLAAITTDDEWAELGQSRDRAMDAAIKSIQAL